MTTSIARYTLRAITHEAHIELDHIANTSDPMSRRIAQISEAIRRHDFEDARYIYQHSLLDFDLDAVFSLLAHWAAYVLTSDDPRFTV